MLDFQVPAPIPIPKLPNAPPPEVEVLLVEG